MPMTGAIAKHQLDAKVGGKFRMSFTQMSNGQSHSEMCYLGWQDSLVLLGRLVEAETQ